jgi:hypothetical protein
MKGAVKTRRKPRKAVCAGPCGVFDLKFPPLANGGGGLRRYAAQKIKRLKKD